jgi:UDPglucose--hexose-1-phosphate uridylyltransferase
MPELRTDWLTGRSVFLAENRALRPNEFATPTAGEPASAGGSLLATCPFCAGNEARTPPAVYETCDAAGRWLVRVVPNAYPAVSNLSGVEGFENGAHNLPAAEAASPAVDLRLAVGATGAHEVIIESPDHVDRVAGLSVAQLRNVLSAYSERLLHWRNERRLRYGLVFKNQGPRAGASLAHVHSQLIALPFIPPAVEAEIGRATQRRQQAGRCAYCELIEQERSAGERVVFDADDFLAFCPFASWQPHEVWLMPTNHEPSFELSSTERLDRLATTLHQLIVRLDAVAPGLHFNMLLRTAPFGGDYDAACHWRIELLPRANSLAGLEVATCLHINPLPPERAAQQLRSA